MYVIDSNVLFSALIKDSLTRRLIIEMDAPLLFPEYIFVEFERHRDLLMRKSKLSRSTFNTLVSILLSDVIIVPHESIKPYLPEAKRIIDAIDPDDAIFIACVLAHPGSVLWSDDARLKRQSEVKMLSTSEVLSLRCSD
jgi:predicted nucleic acid-binding protein